MHVLKRILEVILCSLAVTTLAALAATLIYLFIDTRWALIFVIARWIFIALILLLPFVHMALMKTKSSLHIPWALRTAWTPLLLTIESITIDIISAHLK